jgi:hypothetical protein
VETPYTTPIIQQSLPAPIAATAEYRDRSTGLVVFGIIQIILGLFAALFIPFVLLGILLARKTGAIMPAGYYVLSVTTYALAAVILIALGIGSIRARRWARNLTLITSWMWLIYGAITLVMLTALLPSSFLAGFQAAAARNPQTGTLSAGFAAVILTFVIAFSAIFLVVLPVVFVVFYRKPDVQETCKRRDPVMSWTERAPLPVLTVSVIFTVGAVYYFLMSFTIPVFPFFGKYLTGVPGGAVCIVLAALDAFLAVSLFRQKILGWWIAVGALVLRAIAMGVTFRRGNLLEAYSRMGWSTQQLELMQHNPMYRSGGILWIGLIFLVLLLGYLIWIKRYFVTPVTPQPPMPEPYQAPIS